MNTTVGQLLLNEALPADMRDYDRVIDKKSLQKLFTELAEKHPDEYAEVTQKFHNIGHDVVTRHGGVASLSLAALRTPQRVKDMHGEIQTGIQQIIHGPGTPKEKDDAIVKLVGGYTDKITDANYEEGLRENNPLALQVQSGSRGNKNQFRSLRGGDLLVSDHKDNVIPIPMLASYSEGLDPVQYWGSAYGARKGAVSVKFATPKSGFLGKQLAMATHRLVVTEKDCGTSNGIPVPGDDPESEGAVLAGSFGEHKAGSVITPKMLKSFGDHEIIVRSPMTCQAERGICQKCAGVREHGKFPSIGENVGIAASQVITEPIGQGQLSAKHKGGQAESKGRSAKGGLDLVNQLVQVPDTFQGGAAIAQQDGTVDGITDAPQGGKFINIGGTQHWVPPGEDPGVRTGEKVEAGDVISGGLPNPAEIVKHKGVGEGRRYFMDLMHHTLKTNGFPAHRRNVELLSRGLINHVRITDPDGPADTVPDDVVEYDSLVRDYQPRFGTQQLTPHKAVGMHLERPALHYSIGTRITPKVANTLKKHGVADVQAHPDVPSFAPEMTRAMETLSHSPDWMVRLGGFQLKKGLIESVHRGRQSETHGTSYIPALAQGTDFGKPPDGIGY